MSKGTTWTDAEFKTLRIMAGRGESDSDIADALGRTEKAVQMMRQKQGIKRGEKKGRSFWTAEEDAEIRKGKDAGLNSAEVGRIVGRSRYAVLKRAAKLGISFGKSENETPERTGNKEYEQMQLEVPETGISQYPSPDMIRAQAMDARLAELRAEYDEKIGKIYDEMDATCKAFQNVLTRIVALEEWAARPALSRGKFYGGAK